MTKRLIVNADDFGMSPMLSRGVMDGHVRGCVTSTSALTVCAGAVEDIRRARTECPSLGIGVHLCLTQFAPLSPVAEVSTLVNDAGEFFGIQDFVRRRHEMDPEQVSLELRRQLERFLSSGASPTHLDSHQFVTNWYPPFVDAMLELAREFALPVRWASRIAAVFAHHGRLTEREADDAMSAAADLARRHHARTPDAVILEFFGDTATASNLHGLLDGVSTGVTELMCHPGRSEDLPASESYRGGRDIELDLLCSDAVRARLADNEIELVNFSSLRE